MPIQGQDMALNQGRNGKLRPAHRQGPQGADPHRDVDRKDEVPIHTETWTEGPQNRELTRQAMSASRLGQKHRSHENYL